MCTMNFELRILILSEYLVFHRILIFNADYELPVEDFGTSFVRTSPVDFCNGVFHERCNLPFVDYEFFQ